MHPIPFKETNMNLGAGDNPNTEDMPVAICMNAELSEGQEIPFTVSCWKLSKEELEEINRTGEIWLSTMGYPPPPIMAMAYDPFKNYGFAPLDLVK